MIRATQVLSITLLALLQTLSLSYSEAQQPSANPSVLPPEYLLFEIPDLPLYGDLRHSWFVLRPPGLWTPSGVIDFSQVEFPKWDKNQIPPFIVPSGSLETEVVISNSANQEIDRLPLKKPWAPGLYVGTEAKRAARFHFEVVMKPERVRFITRKYDWPRSKEIFRCKVKVDEAKVESENEFAAAKKIPMEENEKVKTCLDSIRGIAKSAEASQQWYAEIRWPKKVSRRGRRFIAENERELRQGLSRNRHLLMSNMDTDDEFIATAGLTQNELLPEMGIKFSSLPSSEWQGPAATREQAMRPVATLKTSDQGTVIINAFASDTISTRSLKSPVGFSENFVDIQFVKAPEARIRKTDFKEGRTGLVGFLRPWMVSTSMNYHALNSGRGEGASSFNLPAFEAAWNSDYHRLEPFARLETGLIHYDHSLAVQESHAGARWRWTPELSLSAGFFDYALRGRNPGSTRLGSLQAVSVGGHALIRRDQSFLRGHLNFLLSDPFSYEGYGEASRFLKTETDLGLFVGVFAGYASYRSTATNVLRQLETFSENRFRIGVTIGLAGPDYFAGPSSFGTRAGSPLASRTKTIESTRSVDEQAAQPATKSQDYSDKPYGAHLSVSPTDSLYILKGGAGGSWRRNQDWSHEFSFLTGSSLTENSTYPAMAKVTASQVSLNNRFFPRTSSFNWSFGLSHWSYDLQLPTSYVSRQTGGSQGSMTIQNISLQAGVGNHWHFDHYFVNVDWLIYNMPLYTLSSEQRALDLTINGQDRQNLEEASKSLRNSPKFEILKTTIGMSF